MLLCIREENVQCWYPVMCCLVVELGLWRGLLLLYIRGEKAQCWHPVLCCLVEG